MAKELLTYSELLKNLEKNETTNNHLLLGNGFNLSLKIDTRYKKIFSRMKRKYPDYEKVEGFLKNNNYDIEELLRHLKEQFDKKKQIDDYTFLGALTENTIKLDFMKATNEIAREKFNKVYKKNNAGIYSLLKNFANYFTLNYDPFLYLFLMKFMKDDQENEMSQSKNSAYEEIRKAKESGELDIFIGGSKSNIELKKIKKVRFETLMKVYSDEEGRKWKVKDIKRICNELLRRDSILSSLTVNDGLGKNSEDQNVYFLHGAFHFIKNGKNIEKITAKQNMPFIENLGEVISDEKKDIVYVFTSNTREKERQIKENSYLSKCFNNLSKISGSLVILGSSLADNDEHIFKKINESDINQIYIGTSQNDKHDHAKRAVRWFKGKEIFLFDYNTITYTTESNK